MASFNKVILLGNLTRDPELRYLPSNVPVCQFGLAVNRRWRDKDGNQKEETCFVDLTAWGKQAETINQYMTKGKPILVEGHLRFEQWTGQDGQRRSKLSVWVENFQFVGSREGGGGAGGERPAVSTDARRAAPAPSAGYSYSGGPGAGDPMPPEPEDVPPDNIPF